MSSSRNDASIQSLDSSISSLQCFSRRGSMSGSSRTLCNASVSSRRGSLINSSRNFDFSLSSIQTRRTSMSNSSKNFDFSLSSMQRGSSSNNNNNHHNLDSSHQTLSSSPFDNRTLTEHTPPLMPRSNSRRTLRTQASMHYLPSSSSTKPSLQERAHSLHDFRRRRQQQQQLPNCNARWEAPKAQVTSPNHLLRRFDRLSIQPEVSSPSSCTERKGGLESCRD